MTEADDPEDGDVLAHALMSEVTGRLEDLATLSVDLHQSTAPAADLMAGVRDVLALLAAREVLAGHPTQ